MLKSIIKQTKNYAKLLHNFFLDIIFPIECLSCEKINAWLCDDCNKSLHYENTKICPSCNNQSKNGKYCINCKKKYNLKLNGVWIAFSYDNKIIKNLIKKMKYHFIKDISLILTNHLITFIKNSDEINKIVNSKNTIIIPVPLFKKKIKWRGFNQSEEIAKHFSKKLNLNLNTKNLIKIKNNKTQTNLKKENRIQNVFGVYKWTGENIKNKKIILIDDVLTSGATLNECAKILKKHKAKKVWGLVVAKNITF